jgi:hypothetical protein
MIAIEVPEADFPDVRFAHHEITAPSNSILHGIDSYLGALASINESEYARWDGDPEDCHRNPMWASPELAIGILTVNVLPSPDRL